MPPIRPKRPEPRGDARRHLRWREVRISYFTLQFWGVVLALIAVGAAANFLYARSRGSESLVGRVFSLARRSVDRRIQLMTGTKDAGELLEQRYATLSFFSGRVEIQRATDLAWRGAEDDMRLASGDRVRTFSSARAEVSFDDGNVLRIKPDSLIVIGDLTENVRTKVRKSSVRLLVSNIEADIKKSVVRGSQFRLEMPTATADVEKARLSVEIRPDKQSQVSVYSGQVALDTGAQKVQVTDRTSVVINALKEISRPENLLPAPRLRTPRPLETWPTASGGVVVPCAWEPVPGARAYRVEVAGDRFFDKPVFARDDVRETAVTTSALSQGVYFVRVAALDTQGRAGDFSDPVPLRVVLDRVAPTVEVQKCVALRTGRGRELLVNGRTEPGATVSVGGVPVTVDASGYFSAVIRGPAAEGAEAEVVARDRAGNVTSFRQAVGS
ncbi:MAG TPA: FecR domain-containing protein, partial [bacterium]